MILIVASCSGKITSIENNLNKFQIKYNLKYFEKRKKHFHWLYIERMCLQKTEETILQYKVQCTMENCKSPETTGNLFADTTSLNPALQKQSGLKHVE